MARLDRQVDAAQRPQLIAAGSGGQLDQCMREHRGIVVFDIALADAGELDHGGHNRSAKTRSREQWIRTATKHRTTVHAAVMATAFGHSKAVPSMARWNNCAMPVA